MVILQRFQQEFPQNYSVTLNLFNFIGDGMEKNRNKLLDENFNLANWDINLATKPNNCF